MWESIRDTKKKETIFAFEIVKVKLIGQKIRKKYKQMSDFGFKKIKHNDWIGSSSEDEIQIKSFEPRNEKKNDEKDVEINEEKQIS